MALSEEDKQKVLALAKQGNTSAISKLINNQLSTKGITAIVTKHRYFDKEERLKIVFEYEQAKSKEKILLFTQKFFQKLNPQSIVMVMIYGRKAGNDAADWRDEIKLITANDLGDNINSSSETNDLQKSRTNLSQEEMTLISQDDDQDHRATIKPFRNKSRYLAAFLAFFCGGLGVHYFYIGAWGWGLVCLLLYWTNIILFTILGLFSGITYLFLTKEEFKTKTSSSSGPFDLSLYKFALVKLLKPEKSRLDILRDFLWVAFAFFLLTSVVCLFNPEARANGLKLAILALITFPPTYGFMGGMISSILPSKYISKAGAKNISYISACILLGYTAMAFMPDTYTRTSNPSSGPSSNSPSSNSSGSQEVGTVWECYKSTSNVYETLEYPTPRESPGTSCTKIK